MTGTRGRAASRSPRWKHELLILAVFLIPLGLVMFSSGLVLAFWRRPVLSGSLSRSSVHRWPDPEKRFGRIPTQFPGSVVAQLRRAVITELKSQAEYRVDPEERFGQMLLQHIRTVVALILRPVVTVRPPTEPGRKSIGWHHVLQWTAVALFVLGLCVKGILHFRPVKTPPGHHIWNKTPYSVYLSVEHDFVGAVFWDEERSGLLPPGKCYILDHRGGLFYSLMVMDGTRPKNGPDARQRRHWIRAVKVTASFIVNVVMLFLPGHAGVERILTYVCDFIKDKKPEPDTANQIKRAYKPFDATKPKGPWREYHISFHQDESCPDKKWFNIDRVRNLRE